MNYDESALNMIRELSDAPGASGFEEEVVAVARRWAAPIGEMKEDFLRNLYIYRKENRGNKPVLNDFGYFNSVDASVVPAAADFNGDRQINRADNCTDNVFYLVRVF